MNGSNSTRHQQSSLDRRIRLGTSMIHALVHFRQRRVRIRGLAHAAARFARRLSKRDAPMGNIKTPFARHPWLVMLVALPEGIAKRCAASVLPIPTLRVSGTAEALEKIAAISPLVVVVHQAAPDDVARLRAAGEVAGASVFEAKDDASLEQALRKAVDESEAARALSSPA
jgi:hypothetical protein